MQKINLVHTKNTAIAMFSVLIIGCAPSDTSTNEMVETTTVETKEVVTYTPETLSKEIAKIEESLTKSFTPNKEAERAKLIEFYDSYYKLFSGTKDAPEMLFKAGNESVNLQKYQDALNYYHEVEVNYYEFQKRPECVYLQGFIYDSYTNELGKAKEKYEYLIERYPKHVLAKDAKISLENMGKSDEELIRQFEKQNANS